MTLPVRRAVIRPSFASIAGTLREEFANKGLRLYENIYIDIYRHGRSETCQCGARSGSPQLSVASAANSARLNGERVLLLCLACASALPLPVSPSTGRKRNRERGASKSRSIQLAVLF